MNAKQSYDSGSSHKFFDSLESRKLLHYCGILSLLARMHHEIFISKKIHAAAAKTVDQNPREDQKLMWNKQLM